ncbi:MAG: HAMP domain-containing protein [Capsulimonadales bacterium]|nr:HAMP domain-containing protein [Capsulimonadales bacterium]
MRLIPRQPLRRLQWRLTGVFMLATVAASVLMYLFLTLLTLGLLYYASDPPAEVREEFIKSTPEVEACFVGPRPDLVTLTRKLDYMTLADENLPDGLEFRYLSITSGRATVVIADRKEILTTSPENTIFVPGKRLPDLVNVHERRILERAWKGEVVAEWDEGQVVAAGPIRRNGIVVAVGFARTGRIHPGPGTWKSLINMMISSIIVTAMGSAVVGGLLGTLIARGVTRRLNAISRAADAWAEGDLHAVAPEKPEDELGLLALRLNRMAGDLQQVMSLRNEVAALEERQRITRDLHDTVKQEAFATAMMVASAQQCLRTNDVGGLRRALDEAESLSRQMQTDLSGILMQLRTRSAPTLTERLETITAAWRRRSEITLLHKSPDDTDDITESVAEQAARVAEEALANAVKHSEATVIEVTLERAGERYRLTVADNGRGFRPETPAHGMGLGTMRERATLLPKGRLEITSAPGRGTRVILEFEGGEKHG